MRLRPAILSLLLLGSSVCHAYRVVYEKEDSLKVVTLLAGAPSLETTNEYMVHFGRQLQGVPYVAKTLEKGDTENLIINLRELDCTTFTENVLALSLCMRDGRRSFGAFTDYIRRIRYDKGVVAYESRLHYFTSWIDSNTLNGFVSEGAQEDLPSSVFSRTQTLSVNYMSTHTSLYPALKDDEEMTGRIARTEKALTGRKFKYIPKSSLSSYSTLKEHIRSGDIIAILTSKQGLDTSHIGIALWHSDGTLHLLNASQIHKKVIDEPMTLYRYMQKHPSQTGIRVIHTL